MGSMDSQMSTKKEVLFDSKKSLEIVPGKGEQCSNLENARKFLSYELGSGKKIVLWHDHWHPDGILNQRYGPRVIYIYIYMQKVFLRQE